MFFCEPLSFLSLSSSQLCFMHLRMFLCIRDLLTYLLSYLLTYLVSRAKAKRGSVPMLWRR